ncbi:IclR family transcriptional regulator [Alteribacillus sp. JSM 102045]|uniref:IclR family transcriptional regulator n=1 Tax=Alteribacillus sp. JSM 102045 TaxID=1562101 RepID=UPI0035C1B581
MGTQNRSYGNVAHALDVLLLFRKHDELTLGEIAELLDVRKSYLSKLLDTLQEKEFLSKDTQTGTYSLGLSCLELRSSFEKRMDVRKITRPYLEKLASNTKELVHLGVLDSNVVVLLDRITGNDSGLRLQFHLSLTSPPYSTALGKVLLAYSNPDFVDKYLSNEKLQSFTPHTTVDPDMLQLELSKIREKGFYLSYETFESGVSCLGAPIFGKDGNISAAISICAPTVRIMSNEQDYIEKLGEATYQVSRNLGYSSDLSYSSRIKG